MRAPLPFDTIKIEPGETVTVPSKEVATDTFGGATSRFVHRYGARLVLGGSKELTSEIATLLRVTWAGQELDLGGRSIQDFSPTSDNGQLLAPAPLKHGESCAITIRNDSAEPLTIVGALIGMFSGDLPGVPGPVIL